MAHVVVGLVVGGAGLVAAGFGHAFNQPGAYQGEQEREQEWQKVGKPPPDDVGQALWRGCGWRGAGRQGLQDGGVVVWRGGFLWVAHALLPCA